MKILYFIIIFLISFTSNCRELYLDKIEFNGLKTIKPKVILKKFKKKESVSSSDFFKELVSLNAFDYIRINVQQETLFVNVAEKPYIRSIKISNEKKTKELSEIFDKCDMRAGMLYDTSNSKFLKYQLEHYYVSKGFYECKIKIKTKFNRKLNFVDINININKNKILKIKKIKLQGNNIYSEKYILKCIGFSESFWTSWYSDSNIFLKSRLRSDLKKLKLFYMKNGYASFQINYVRLFLDKKCNVKIIIDVSEGEIHEFGRVLLEGGYFSEPIKSDLIEIFSSHIKEGSRFCIDIIDQTKLKIANYFGDNGYMNTKIFHKILNNGEKKVNISFRCEISPKIRIGSIFFAGNKTTSETFLRGCVPIEEGDIVCTKLINTGRQEIMRREVTDKVGLSYLNSEKVDELDILLRIHEKRSRKFTAGFSYTKDEKASLNMSAELSNFFGIGNDLSMTLTHTKTTAEYGMAYTRSRIQDKDYDANYNMYLKQEDFDYNITYFDYGTDSAGLFAEYQIYIGTDEQINIGTGSDWLVLKLNEDRASDRVRKFIDRYGCVYTDAYFSVGYTKNTLDKTVNPTSGSLETINLKWSTPWADLSYFQFSYELNYYTNIKNNVLSFYTNLCYGNRLLKKYEYPFFKNFLLRGQTGIRGYKDKTLGPRESNNDNVGGNLIFCSKTLLYFNLPYLKDNESIRTALFFDIGQGFNTSNFSNKNPQLNKKIKFNSFVRASLGVTLLWNTPFGIPIECALAYPLNPEDSDKLKLISVTVGT